MLGKERPLGKENIPSAPKQSSKLLPTNSSVKAPRTRFYSADLAGPCNCESVAVRSRCDCSNNVFYNGSKSSSSTRRTPFRIHFDRAGNDLNKGARFRERIVEYETRRLEEFKRNTRLSENKIERNVQQQPLPSSSTRKQQFSQASNNPTYSRNLKESQAIARNLALPSNKATVRSIQAISTANLPKLRISTARSLVNLSQACKQSTLSNKACDTVKRNLAKSSSVEKSLNRQRSSSTTSINKPIHLGGSPSSTKSSFNQRTLTTTRSRIASTGSTYETPFDVQNRPSESKYKKFGGSRDSLISGFTTIVSCDSSRKQIAWQRTEDSRVQENTKVSLRSNFKDALIDGSEICSDDREVEIAENAIPQKIQAKVESEVVVKENTDFSAYLLYHTDYLVDLLIVEKEKENCSPKLSSRFIEKYIDSEPRKTIVAFLIHLATHCRYASFILYQAVKLFDAVLDKISIDIADMQLVAITALWIVLKKDGNFNKIPSAQSMFSLAQDLQYDNVNILVEWEKLVLHSLNFNVTFSDPFSIFVFYVINCDYDQNISHGVITKIYYCGGYVIDLTLLDAKFCYVTSNYLALVAAELVLCLVLSSDAEILSPQWQFWRRVITNGCHIPIRIFDDEITLLRATMIQRVLESAKKHTKEEVVRKRYSHNRYGNISEFFIEKIKKIPLEEYSISL